MTEIETEVVETEDAGSEVDTELDATMVVEDIIASQADDTDEAADTVTTDDEVFVPTDTQIELAKQLGFDDDYASNMTEAQAEAAVQFGKQQSRYFQRKGKEKQKTEQIVDAYSSIDDDIDDYIDIDADDGDDDEFTEDDWFTDEGRAKINAVLKLGSQTKNTDKQRLKAEADKAFDGLDKDAFEAFLPGESALIEPGSPADEKRAQALAMAKTIQATADSLGHTLTLEKAVVQALSIIAPAETENAALNKANAGRKKRGSQRISAPSHITGKHKVREATEEEQAVADTFDALNPTWLLRRGAESWQV